MNSTDNGFVLNGSMIEYSYGGNHWSMSCDDIGVLGEYTDSNGPYADDFWLVFIDKKGAVCIGSFYAPGRDLVDNMLKSTGILNDYGLCNSTEFKSRIIYPTELRGEPLYTFTKKRLSGIRGWLLRETEVEFNLTEVVKKHLSHAHNQSLTGST